MPLTDSDIIWRQSVSSSDTTPAQNGGRMGYVPIVSGVKNNLFPDAPQAERLAGSTKFRKAFIHINSTANIALQGIRIFIDTPTPAEDYLLFYPGTQTDTENQISGRPYGIGTLAAEAPAGTESLQVLCEHLADYTTLMPFRVGDLIRIADIPATAAPGGTGTEVWKTLTGVSYGATTATLEFAGAPLEVTQAVAGTVVSAVYQPPDQLATWGDFLKTASNASYNTASGNLTAHNRGSIAQHWTLTFTSATSFSCSGDALGQLAGSGSTAADYAPVNPGTGTPYFTLKSAGHGGTWAPGDTLSFTTTPAAIPLWYRRRIPAGTASIANNTASLAIHGEST